MRSIKWLLIVVGVSALALVFLGRVAADRSFNAKDFGRTGGTTFAFRMAPVKSFSSDSGTSGLATAPRQDILRVGVLTAKAGPDSCTTTTGTPPVTTCTPSTHGTLSGRTIATTDTNTGATKVIVFSWTGEFKVNMDGTGVFTINAPTALSCFDSTAAVLFTTPIGAAPGPPPPPAITVAANCPLTDEGAETYAFVIVESREKIHFIQTDNSGGGAKIFLQGEALEQEKKEQEND